MINYINVCSILMKWEGKEIVIMFVYIYILKSRDLNNMREGICVDKWVDMYVFIFIFMCFLLDFMSFFNLIVFIILCVFFIFNFVYYYYMKM